MGQAQMSAARRRILLLDDSYISLGSVLKKKIFFTFQADEYTWRGMGKEKPSQVGLRL
jgi:hypothetical protein